MLANCKSCKILFKKYVIKIMNSAQDQIRHLKFSNPCSALLLVILVEAFQFEIG